VGGAGKQKTHENAGRRKIPVTKAFAVAEEGLRQKVAVARREPNIPGTRWGDAILLKGREKDAEDQDKGLNPERSLLLIKASSGKNAVVRHQKVRGNSVDMPGETR
jgi:hypothetical protein